MKGLWIWLVFTLAGAACGLASPQQANSRANSEQIGKIALVPGGGSFTDLLPEQLNSHLDESVFLVNVHVPSEGEIPGTDAHIPFDEISSRLSEFPASKEAEVIVYCRSGSMSASAVRDLVSEGYTNVYNLDGGFRAWMSAGFPFDR